jgi:hypothetical protein
MITTLEAFIIKKTLEQYFELKIEYMVLTFYNN